MDLISSTEITMLWRLFTAGLLGAIIGVEREFRAKEAGLRTHFLVAVGSALFMLVSQHGFSDVTGISGVDRVDGARIAAQIVTGIGFIGAGAIMVQRHYVRGLTTAAGLWVVAAIGMAAAGGLYVFAVAGTIFALIGLELFRLLMRWINLRMCEITFIATDSNAIERMLEAIKKLGIETVSYKLFCLSSGSVRVTVSARDRSRLDGTNNLLVRLSGIEGAKIESIE